MEPDGMRLWIEVEVEGESLHGELVRPDGARTPFVGRIGLLAALDEALGETRASAPREEETPCGD
ncbi:MAG: hypothetical protein R3C15_21600 [Thermoleophilia bacterium]